MRIEPTKKTETGVPAARDVANRAPNGTAPNAKHVLAPPFSAFDAEKLQALFVALAEKGPQDYTSIADPSGLLFGAEEVGRSFGKSALSPRTIRVGGRRTSVRLEPEFWMAIAYIVAAAKIDQGLFFLDIERRCGRFAFASKIRSAVVSALLTMALVDRLRNARAPARAARKRPARRRARA